MNGDEINSRNSESIEERGKYQIIFEEKETSCMRNAYMGKELKGNSKTYILDGETSPTKHMTLIRDAGKKWSEFGSLGACKLQS